MPQKLYDKNLNFYQLYFEELSHEKEMLDWFSFGFEDQLRDDFKGKLTIDRSLIRTFDYYADRHNYYPAMLIPSRAKDELAFPAQHYFSLTSYMHQVDTLCIVGWKGKTFQSFVTKERRKTSKIGNCRPPT